MPHARRRAVLGGLAALPLARPGLAQAFPARPIQLIVPFAPGGGTDISARHYAAAATRLGMPMQVIPMAGAGGARGSRSAAEAAPDGHTLLFGTMGSTITAALMHNTGYTPDSFDPIAIVGTPSFIFAVAGTSPIRSVADLVAAAKRSQISYGSAGAGSSTNLVVELFARRAGVEFLHIPFNGSAEALTAMLGGHVQLTVPTTGSTLPPMRSGHVRGIAITAEARTPEAPELPTFRESGVDLVFYNWRGILAPRGLPPAVAAALTDLSRRIVAEAEFAQQFARAEGEPPVFRDNLTFARQIAEETAMQREIVAALQRR